MSVDYTARIYFGVLINEETYNKLPDEIKEEYVHRADCYRDNTDLIFGIPVLRLPLGEYKMLESDDLDDLCDYNEYNKFFKLCAEYNIDASPCGLYGGIEIS